MTRFSNLYRTLAVSVALITNSVVGQDIIDEACPVPPKPQFRHEAMSFNDFVARRRQLEGDLQNLTATLRQRRDSLIRWDAGAQSSFQAAFGTIDPQARDEVVGHFDRQLAHLQNLGPSNFEESPFTVRRRIAYVYPDDPSRIYLDDGFASAPANGVNSRMGTIAHEISHFNRVAGTEDHVYGVSDSNALARRYERGETAIQPWRNADNIEYFLEGAFEPPAQSAEVAPGTPAPSSSEPEGNAEFRAHMEQRMQHFQAAAEYNQQHPLRIDVPRLETQSATESQSLVNDENAPCNQVRGEDRQPVRSQDQTPEITRRNPATNVSNDPQVVSFRGQHDEQGYRRSGTSADSQTERDASWATRERQSGSDRPRQNRVYSIDGSSRPIGRGDSSMQSVLRMQQFAAGQIAQQQAARQPRYSDSSSSLAPNTVGSNVPEADFGASNSVRTTSDNVTSTPQSSATLTFNENAQQSAPVSVSPRQSGAREQTAGLVLP